MINTSIDINDKPCAIRYPRGTGIGAELPSIEEKIAVSYTHLTLPTKA